MISRSVIKLELEPGVFQVAVGKSYVLFDAQASVKWCHSGFCLGGLEIKGATWHSCVALIWVNCLKESCSSWSIGRREIFIELINAIINFRQAAALASLGSIVNIMFLSPAFFSRTRYSAAQSRVSVYNFVLEYLLQPSSQLLEAGGGRQKLFLTHLFAACQRKGLNLPSEQH